MSNFKIFFSYKNTFLSKITIFHIFHRFGDHPWRKYRIEIHSESIRTVHIHSNICIRTNLKNILYLVWWKTVKNQSDLIRLIPRHQSVWIWTNPKPSFQFRSIRINPNHSDLGFIRIYSEWKFGLDQSKLGLVLFDVDWKLTSDWFGFIPDWCLRINRIKSDWFLTVFHQTRYKCFSDWFGYKYRNEP